jgi:hypothetical protein
MRNRRNRDNLLGTAFISGSNRLNLRKIFSECALQCFSTWGWKSTAEHRFTEMSYSKGD